jgi:CelD/BcsL family acetyltransferase involved in cellulose biosynthesis
MTFPFAAPFAAQEPSYALWPAAANDEILVTVETDYAAVEADWRAFESRAVGRVYQSFEWFSLWHTSIGEREGVMPQIVLGRSAGGELLFLLPLGIAKRSGANALVWLGGDQADVKAGLFAPEFLRGLKPGEWDTVWSRILDQLPPLDLVCLDDQPERLDAFENPFLCARTHRLADATHAAALSRNWDAFYKSKRSGSARNLERRRLKQLQALGSVEFEIASDPKRAEFLMQRLLEEKARSLAAMGVADPFAGLVREFFERQVAQPWPKGQVQVSALTLNGEPISLVWALLANKRFYYLVPVYNAEYSRTSPGRVHLTELFRWACENGFETFDLGVGDQDYKFQWCEDHVPLFATVQARSLRGQLAARLIGARTTLKRQIKTSRTLWPLAQAVRARLGAVLA